MEHQAVRSCCSLLISSPLIRTDVAPEILENSNHRRYTRAVDVWSLGVVLYICLCGFPPFSDELYSPENPYTLSQQIKTGRFDFPSPYWDTVDDSALDLIDRMLTVDMDQRFTIDECLEHPWITQRPLNPNDSTDGLTSAFGNINFSKRKVQRERTLLSSINDVRISKVIECNHENDQDIKVYEKNHTSQTNTQGGVGRREVAPSANRNEHEFVEMGGKGDVTLFGDDNSSIYPTNTVAAEKPSKPVAEKKKAKR